jgi:putative endonuclease
MKKSTWYAYVIRTEKGQLYAGITTDIDRRFSEHLSGKKGAKFFRTSAPSELVFKKRFKDRSTASKFEANFKGLNRREKLKFLGILKESSVT